MRKACTYTIPYVLVCDRRANILKVVRVMVAFWRSKGHKVFTVLDEGLGGDRSYQSALEFSNFVKESIQRFGFLLAEEKCKWLPMLQVTWLGYFICMSRGKFYITE